MPPQKALISVDADHNTQLLLCTKYYFITMCTVHFFHFLSRTSNSHHDDSQDYNHYDNKYECSKATSHIHHNAWWGGITYLDIIPYIISLWCNNLIIDKYRVITVVILNKPCSTVLVEIGDISSQSEPLNPGAQVHSNVFGMFLHVPPLRQGSERHIFMSVSQLLPCMYLCTV